MTLNLSAATLDLIYNTTLESFIRDEMFAQADQDTPTLKVMREKKKTFPGGEGLKLTGIASFDYTADWEIFSGEDQLHFNEFNNAKRFTYNGIENHLGMKLTFTELKAAGFMITDANTKGSMDFKRAAKTDQNKIVDYIETKLKEQDFSATQSFSKKRIWSDGSNGFIGVPGIVTQSPSTGVTGGLSRVTNEKWRNRSLVGASKINVSATDQTLTQTMRNEMRQLRRYGGKPDFVACGSQAIQAFEKEIQAKGLYSQTGFKNGKIDIGINGISIVGLPALVYEPALDDLDMADYFYILDTNAICLTMLEGDDMQVHLPARPHDKMAGYKSVTWTGMVAAHQLNSSGVYQIDTADL